MCKLVCGLLTCCLLFTTLTPAFAKPASHRHSDKFNAGSLVAGDGYTGLCNPDGKVLMWGDNASGQLGDGSVLGRL